MIIMPLKLASTLPWDKRKSFIYLLVSSSHLVSAFRKLSRCPLSQAPFVSSIRKGQSWKKFDILLCNKDTLCLFTDTGVWHLGNSGDNCYLKLLQRGIIRAFHGAFLKIPAYRLKN